MKVEVLYFPGCPNHQPALERVRSVLAEEGVSAEVRQVEVADARAAEALSFPGSPTVRIDGADVEGPAATPGAAGLICRVYRSGLRREGIPPADLIRRAIRRARDGSP